MGPSGDDIHDAQTREIAGEDGGLDQKQQVLVLRSLAGTDLSTFRLFELVTKLRGNRRGRRWLLPLAIVGMGAIAAAVLLAFHGFDELALEGVKPGNSFGATLLLATICVGVFGFVVIEFGTLVLLFRMQAEMGIEHVLELNLRSPKEEEEPKRSWLTWLLSFIPGIPREH